MRTELSTALASDDPSVGLRAVVALQRLAEQVEANQVAAARAMGWSWEQIGDALGVSRQAVHKKHGRTGRRADPTGHPHINVDDRPGG